MHKWNLSLISGQTNDINSAQLLRRYPGPILSPGRPVLLHAYTPQSAFLQCLWNCSGSLEALVSSSPPDTHYVFMSYRKEAEQDALWMRARFHNVSRDMRHAHSR